MNDFASRAAKASNRIVNGTSRANYIAAAAASADLDGGYTASADAGYKVEGSTRGVVIRPDLPHSRSFGDGGLAGLDSQLAKKRLVIKRHG